MNKQQATDIIKRIAAAYTQFDLNKKVGRKRMELWFEHLEKLEYLPTLEKINQHIAEHKFPPTIAEIRIAPKQKNDYLEKVQLMKREARNARLH